MPRIAKPITQEVEGARALVRAYLQQDGVNETSLAEATGVKQYQVSRLMTGRLKNLSQDAATLAAYAKNEMAREPLSQTSSAEVPEPTASTSTQAQLHAAVLAAWDGSEAGAALLKDFLQALSPVLRRHVRA